LELSFHIGHQINLLPGTGTRDASLGTGLADTEWASSAALYEKQKASSMEIEEAYVKDRREVAGTEKIPRASDKFNVSGSE
jgi:hypothetical protein